MATIKLQDVTKTFPKRARADGLVISRGVAGSQVDHAFAERAAGRAVQEHYDAGHAGPVIALNQVNLTIPDGQTIAVLGPSGCGKSTLLRVVAGLEPGYTGHVFYDDRDMRDVPPKDRFIGMVFQNYALYPHFEGHGNLAFFFRMHKAPDTETEERIRITSEIMGIGFKELLERKPGTLSGGQQQRVAIGRAIVRKPHLFLFDEPLSNLDAKLRTQTRVEIKRLLRRFQITAIYVTHDQMEAITLGDQIAVMRAGRIEQVDPYHELRQSPATGFVAGFLGYPPMSLLADGIVVEGMLRLGEIDIPLPDSVKAQVRVGQAVAVGVRPEVVSLAFDDAAPPGTINLRGVVGAIEPDFARRTQLVHVEIGPVACAATGDLDPSLNLGDAVSVLIPIDQLYYFDSESDLRIM
jgi:ABC-type sugar transport system ATPase subunit